MSDGVTRTQRRLVARRRKASEIAAVLEHAVGQREEGRGVVELHVAGKTWEGVGVVVRAETASGHISVTARSTNAQMTFR